jgi:TolB-like protein
VVEERAQRHLAAILAADVAGYSRLMERDEADTYQRLRAHRKELFEPGIRQHGGRIFKLMGDGLMCEFASVVDAVECAVALQRGMAERNAGLAGDRRIDVRIGINLGDIIVEGDDCHGDGVNVAARLQAQASPGGICISAAVQHQIAGKLPFTARDLGDQSFKNMAAPVRVYEVEFGAAPLRPADSGAAAVPGDSRPTIAILPFANLGGDPEQDYFSEGITEDIITDLSRWRSLAVQSRSASFRYRGSAIDMKQVARDLRVRYILEGSVRRLGARIRITAQLIDSETGAHVWAERFDRDASDLFEVQDQVVRTIVSTLVGRMQAADVERTRRKPPASLAAYECVLQGNALPWDDPAGAAEAIRLFEKATEIDPGYGFAYALLSVMHYRLWINDLSGSNALLDRSHELAQRAVALDGNESTCFAALAVACLLRRSFDLALQHMARAVEINPTNQWNAADMGSMLPALGRAEEALGWMKRAREIDPYFNPPWYWFGIGGALVLLRRFEEALAAFERPSVRPFYIAAYMAGCHAMLGATDRARALAAECREKKPDFTIGRWMVKDPHKNPADAALVIECFRRAGLPE